eukprot:413837-Pyramimonas_sp.AAC.1
MRRKGSRRRIGQPCVFGFLYTLYTLYTLLARARSLEARTTEPADSFPFGRAGPVWQHTAGDFAVSDSNTTPSHERDATPLSSQNATPLSSQNATTLSSQNATTLSSQSATPLSAAQVIIEPHHIADKLYVVEKGMILAKAPKPVKVNGDPFGEDAIAAWKC